MEKCTNIYTSDRHFKDILSAIYLWFGENFWGRKWDSWKWLIWVVQYKKSDKNTGTTIKKWCPMESPGALGTTTSKKIRTHLERKSGRLLKMFKLLVERKDKRRECTFTGYKQYWILLIYTLPTKRESTVKRREVSALKQTHSFERIEIRDTRPSDGEYIVAGHTNSERKKLGWRGTTSLSCKCF